jgi:hypothetical protein
MKFFTGIDVSLPAAPSESGRGIHASCGRLTFGVTRTRLRVSAARRG